MIVPGSLPTLMGLPPLDHPFSWYAKVRHRVTGKEWTYWFNGTQLNRELVAAHIEANFRNVVAVTIDPCTTAPIGVLQPVPPDHFEFGFRKEIEDSLKGIDPDRPQPMRLRPLTIKPLYRRL